MRAVAMGATTEEIETEIDLQPGALVAELLSDRTLLLRWASALVERAEGFDRRAQRLLAAVAGGAVRTPAVRATLDYSNTLRCGAEAARRQSEALLRKVALGADRDASQVKARVQRLFDTIIGAANAFVPATARDLFVTTDDPLEGARQLLPQLQTALIEAAGGQRRFIGDCIRRTEQYISRREGPTAESAEPARAPPVLPPATPVIMQQPAPPTLELAESSDMAELRDSVRRAKFALDSARQGGRPTGHLEKEVRKRSTALYNALLQQLDAIEARAAQAPLGEREQLQADRLAEEAVDLEDELATAGR